MKDRQLEKAVSARRLNQALSRAAAVKRSKGPQLKDPGLKLGKIQVEADMDPDMGELASLKGEVEEEINRLVENERGVPGIGSLIDDAASNLHTARISTGMLLSLIRVCSKEFLGDEEAKHESTGPDDGSKKGIAHLPSAWIPQVGEKANRVVQESFAMTQDLAQVIMNFCELLVSLGSESAREVVSQMKGDVKPEGYASIREKKAR